MTFQAKRRILRHEGLVQKAQNLQLLREAKLTCGGASTKSVQDGFPTPEISRSSQNPSEIDLTSRKSSIGQFLISKPKSRFGEQSVPLIPICLMRLG